MNKAKSIISAWAFFALTGGMVPSVALSADAGSASAIVQITPDNFGAEIATNKDPAFVFFTASGHPEWDGLQAMIEKAASKFQGQLRFVELDIDKYDKLNPGFDDEQLPIAGLYSDTLGGFKSLQFKWNPANQEEVDKFVQELISNYVTTAKQKQTDAK